MIPGVPKVWRAQHLGSPFGEILEKNTTQIIDYYGIYLNKSIYIYHIFVYSYLLIYSIFICIHIWYVYIYIYLYISDHVGEEMGWWFLICSFNTLQ